MPAKSDSVRAQCSSRIPESQPSTRDYDSDRCIKDAGHAGPHFADFHTWIEPPPQSPEGGIDA